MGTDETSPRPGNDRLARRTLLTGLLGTAAVAVAAPRAFADTGRSADSVATHGSEQDIPRAGEGGQTRSVTLYAVALPNNQLAYGTTPDNASIPGPTLEAVEGDEIHVRLVNTTTETLSLHAHGVDHDAADDGTPANDSTVAPGEERTYVWRTHAPSQYADGTWEPGSAGYWNYHDSAVGSPHGTAGIARGLYGALVVRRTGDPLPELQNVVVFNDITINNRPTHNAVNFTANLGQRVEWIHFTLGSEFHTFHTHAHRWADNRLGLIEGTEDASQVVDNVTTGPGETIGFQVIAGEHVGPGNWMYHCHVQFHSDAGMVGLFVVNNADGSPPPDSEELMERFQANLNEAAAAGGHPGH